VGNLILDIEMELKNAIPSITLLYDPDITPDNFAVKCVSCALCCAKPSFANTKTYASQTQRGIWYRKLLQCAGCPWGSLYPHTYHFEKRGRSCRK
jgi:hypothetical protein